MPVRIEFIESQANLDAFLPALKRLLTDGIIEVQDTMILKAAVEDGHDNSPGERLR